MAGSFNKVILMGTLVKDPELRYTPAGDAVTDIRLAINEQQKGRDKSAVFVDVTLWKKAAETVCEYLRKGSSILVEGRLSTEKWTDRESGKLREKMKVVCYAFQFVDSKDRSADEGSSRSNKSDVGGNDTTDHFPSSNVDDIPF